MTGSATQPGTVTITRLRKHLQNAFCKEAVPGVGLWMRRDRDGLLTIRLVSARFNGVALAERRRQVEAVLSAIEADSALRVMWTLEAPEELDPENADDDVVATAWLGVPTWGDALLRMPSESSPDDRAFGCKVIGFWGVKGGVGRTTALSHVAALLGRRNHKILAIDLDLDSPGLVAALVGESAQLDGRPRIEELVVEAGRTGSPDADLQLRIQQALRPCRDSGAHVDVLGPPIADAAFVQNLLGPLAPAVLYQRPTLHRLIRLAVRASAADLVLLDARSGYCDESAMTVLDLCDEVVIFSSPAPSVFGSLAPAIEALERNRLALGRPRLCHFVASLLPAGEDARKRIKEALPDVIYDVRQRLYAELELPSDQRSPDVSLVCIDYSARVVENDGSLLPGASDYDELARRLLPEDHLAATLPLPKDFVANVIKEAKFSAAQAESEEDTKALFDLFTSPPQLAQFARHDTCLVLGAKGTGKSFLRRMCLEQQALLVRRSGVKALQEVQFVEGFSAPRAGRGAAPPIDQDLLNKLASHPNADWSSIWSALCLGRVLHSLRAGDRSIDLSEFLKQHSSSKPDIIGRWLTKLSDATTASAVSEAVLSLVAQDSLRLHDYWRHIDALCEKRGRGLVLLFDDLDVLLGESREKVEKRKAVLVGLFERLNTSWQSHRWLGAKIFLREDVFISLELEEAAKTRTRNVTLDWKADDLWRLIIRAMAQASPLYGQRLRDMGIDPEQLDAQPRDTWEPALSLLWGERMGEGESQTKSTSWAEARLRDGRNRLFPRAALWLLQQSFAERKRPSPKKTTPPKATQLLDGPTLRAAMPKVAELRLEDLKKECAKGAWDRLQRVRGFLAYQDRSDFVEGLRKAGDSDPEETIKMLRDELGVIEEGSRKNKTPTVRIVDLYAFAPALAINRQGRR